MRIVVLDGYTLNPGDLCWDGFRELGEVAIYEHTTKDQMLERSEGAEVLMTNKTPLSSETIARLPDLRYIGVLATGYNVVDIESAEKRGIVVTNVPAYGTQSVAQMVFALILELCRGVGVHSGSVRAGEWSRSRDFCYWKTPQIELASKTLGLIGLGRIGEAVARAADAFGMRVLAYDVIRKSPKGVSNFAWAEIPELLSQSDIVSLHAPLTPETQGLINRKALAMMKKSAFLINTSRGPVIVDQEVADALNEGIIAGAGLDVLSIEPPSPDNPLLKARNCIITPHIAWATVEARQRLMDIAVENLRAFIAASPVNVVRK